MRRWYELPEDSRETYVFPRSAGGKKGAGKGREGARSRRERIRAELESLHPGFTPLHAVDSRILPGTRGGDLVVTVMTAEALAEARLRARGARLCVVVGGRSEGDGLPSGVRRIECFKKRRWPARGLSLALVLAFGACGGSLFLGENRPAQAEPSPESKAMPAIPEQGRPFPDGTGWLSLVAARIVGTGSSVSAFDFDADRDPPLELDLRAGEPGTVVSSIDGLGLVPSGSVPSISWNEGMAAYSLSWGYAPGTIDGVSFTGLSESLTENALIVERFRNAIAGSGGAMLVSRPLYRGRGTELEIECSVEASDATAFFRAVDECLSSCGVTARALRVTRTDSAESLEVVLSLARSTGVSHASANVGTGAGAVSEEGGFIPDREAHSAVPSAFGALARAKPARKPESAKKGLKPERPAVGAGMERVGSIGSGAGITVSYWRDKEGKIHEIPE